MVVSSGKRGFRKCELHCRSRTFRLVLLAAVEAWSRRAAFISEEALEEAASRGFASTAVLSSSRRNQVDHPAEHEPKKGRLVRRSTRPPESLLQIAESKKIHIVNDLSNNVTADADGHHVLSDDGQFSLSDILTVEHAATYGLLALAFLIGSYYYAQLAHYSGTRIAGPLIEEKERPPAPSETRRSKEIHEPKKDPSQHRPCPKPCNNLNPLTKVEAGLPSAPPNGEKGGGAAAEQAAKGEQLSLDSLIRKAAESTIEGPLIDQGGNFESNNTVPDTTSSLAVQETGVVAGTPSEGSEQGSLVGQSDKDSVASGSDTEDRNDEE
ncbi:unnamed protein product [Amoebophrya sp. A25]|nr:unnamed protein product [Amoebophrya sp. A25]|eukprot:GSA25T00002912001.1